MILDYDFRLLPPAVMAPLQRRMEGRFQADALSAPWKCRLCVGMQACETPHVLWSSGH